MCFFFSFRHGKKCKIPFSNPPANPKALLLPSCRVESVAWDVSVCAVGVTVITVILRKWVKKT